MTPLTDLLGISQQALSSGFIVLLRIGAIMAVLPAFGEQSIPVRVRLALAFAFVLIVTPAIPFDAGVFPPVLLVAFPETITGLFFGLLLRFFIIALQIAGAIAAQSTSLSQIFGGSAGVDPQPAIGRTLVVAGLALATTMGLHVEVAAYILESYRLAPIGSLISPDVIMSVGVDQIARCFALGFRLAAPFVLASLIYNIVLGVINRAMPQLMVSFVGAPAITAGGLLLLFACSPLMLQSWHAALNSFVGNPVGAFNE